MRYRVAIACDRRKAAIRCTLSCILLLSGAPAIARAPAPAEGFARGIVAVARAQQGHDPRAVARFLDIVLRNPGKWLDQPKGTYREAGWRNLRNAKGVASVKLLDIPVDDGKQISSSTDISLNGKPCITINDIERAAGKKASYGGTGYPIVFDAPPPPPVKLGRENASLTIRDHANQPTDIIMLASKAGRAGCLVEVSLQHSRPMRP